MNEREATRKLLSASKKVLADLNRRIDEGHPSAVPVFNGISELHDAIALVEYHHKLAALPPDPRGPSHDQ